MAKKSETPAKAEVPSTYVSRVRTAAIKAGSYSTRTAPGPTVAPVNMSTQAVAPCPKGVNCR